MACGVIKFILPPTAIHSAVYCHFFHKREKCLVVAGLNFIQVYRLNVFQTVFDVAEDAMDTSSSATAPTVQTTSPDPDDDDLYGPSQPEAEPEPKSAQAASTSSLSAENVRLECMASFELFGTISDLKFVSLPNSNRDFLLISFTNAKLSVVQYDPLINDLRSISLHDYEGSRFSDEMPTNLGVAKGVVCVDPDSRCAVMRLYRTQLLVLPFSHAPPRSDNALSGPKPLTQFKSFMLSLKRIKDDSVEYIQDVQMLPGYLEPTVAVLVHKTLSFVGRIALGSDTSFVAALSLNTRQKTYHLIWSCHGLPFDAQYVRNVPRPLGGLIVVCTNAMIYVHQGVQPVGVSLNEMGEMSIFKTRFSLKPVLNVVTALDASHCAFFEAERMLVTVRGGEAFVVTLVCDGVTRALRDFHWQQVHLGRYASCITPLEGGFIFTGGQMNDSFLYTYSASQWIEAEGAHEGDVASPHPYPHLHPHPLKKRKALLDRAEEDDIYGPDPHLNTTTPLMKYHFVLCDVLQTIGACRTSAVGEPVNTLEDFVRTPDKDADLVVSCGFEKEAFVCAMHRSVRPEIVASFDLPDVEDVWTLRTGVRGSTDNGVHSGVDSGVRGSTDSDVDGGVRGGESSGVHGGESSGVHGGESSGVHGGESGGVHGSTDSGVRSSLNNYHDYLVVTTKGRTAVFQSGEEISEDVEHPFRGDEQTVFCCVVGEAGKATLQVTRFRVRVARQDGVVDAKELELKEGEEVTFATEGSGRLAVLTNRGVLWMFQWDSVTESLLEVKSGHMSGITAVSFYTDRSGIFTSHRPTNVGTVDMEFEAEKPDLQRMESHPADEDDYLYIPQSDKADMQKEKRPRTQEELLTFLYSERVNEPSEWLLVVRTDSTLCIYSLSPSDTLGVSDNSDMLGVSDTLGALGVSNMLGVFETGEMVHVPRVIHDVKAVEHSTVPKDVLEAACRGMFVKEVLLIGLGSGRSQPYLFVVVGEDVHVYHVVPFYYGKSEGRLRICFSKVKHDMWTRERRFKRQRVGREQGVGQEDGRLAKRHLRPFQDVKGYSGVFLCFPYSYFVMATARNILRFHPMVIDGPIKAFAEFSNANCDSGFIYYNSRKQIRVACLESNWNYDAVWPLTKIRVPGTVHYLSYHLECKTYVVCTAVFYPERKMIHGGVDQVEEEVEVRSDRFLFPLLPRFSLHLVTPDEWQLVPHVSYSMNHFEHVTAMKVLSLRNGTETGMKEYVVMASNMSYGEDVQSRGRLIVIDVLDLIPEPDQPLTRFKLREIYAEEQKGPVTAICGVNGYIVSAIGQKVFIWTLKGSTLVGVAFLDVQIYVHQLSSIKDLILVADIQRSVSILRFQEKYRTLSLVASDPNQMHTYAAEFCVDNQSLTLAVTDVRQDFQIFHFDPEYYFSSFGNRLVRKMECNLGQFVTNMFRFRCSAWFPDVERVGHLTLTKKHVTMFTTLEGAVGCYVNIPEKTYRRVVMIETILSNHCVHRAGLSSRLYWQAKTSPDERFDLVGNAKTVADGRVASLFMELDYTERYEVAVKIGCGVDTLVEELLDIDRQTSLF